MGVGTVMTILATFAVILTLFILKSGGLIQAKYFRDVGGVDLTKMSSLANRRLTSLAVSDPSSIEIATSIDDTASVHLQLNKKSDTEDEGASQSTEVEEVEGFISITEYIRLSDNSAILATAGAECDNMHSLLEAFSMHIFGSNYTEMEGIQLKKVDKSCYQCIIQKILLFQKNSYHQKYFPQTLIIVLIFSSLSTM